MSVNKQTHPRKRGRVRVRYGIGSLEQAAFTNNLSLSGAFIRTNRVYRPGTTIQLELCFPEEPITMWAQVIWAKQVPPQLAQTVNCGMGVRFFNPAPEWETVFTRWQAGRATL
jgi:Tfp pilus assembly protein PilZ